MDAPAPSPARFSGCSRLWLLLLLSLAARLGLVAAGGQFFFGDESRYLTGARLYQALRTGDWAGAGALLMRPEHAAFNFVNVPVAALQHGLAQFTRWSDWTADENIRASAPLAAAVLALFSVLNIWLGYRLARAAGAGESEAGWVALLLAASNTLFYYSRHLVPYDCALSAGLGGLIFAMGGGRRAAALSGALAAGCFQLYNGYWFLVPVIFLAAQMSPRPVPATRMRIGAAWLLGGIGGTALLMLPGLAFGGTAYLEVMLAFSGSVTQGLFAEGLSFAGEYLWHAEGGLGLGVALAAALALSQALRPGADTRRLRCWGWLLLATWLLPVAASVGLQKFVVYARTVRPLVPLLCLLGGCGLHRLAQHRPFLRLPLASLIAVVALLHFAPHFLRVYPREFATRIRQEYGMVKDWISFTGTIYQPALTPVSRPDLALVNAQVLFPVRSFHGYPAGTVLQAPPHPLAYLPYQYEGHTPRERRLLREHPPVMQLVRLARPETVPDRPPPAMNFTEADRPDGRDRGRPQ